MLDEGTVVFYVDDSEVYSGRVVNVEKAEKGFTFSIDNYGGCEGQYVISSDQIGRTVFFMEEDAEQYRADGI